MPWYHKTLKDMKSAIEREEWDTVVDILKQHNRQYPGQEIAHDISDVNVRIDTYGEALRTMFGILLPYIKERKAPVGNDKTILSVKVDEAINAAAMFERTITDLIKEGKFLT